MDTPKKIYISNIIVYISFIIFLVLDKETGFKGAYVIFAFLPYLTVAYTTFIFNTRFNKNLKKILMLSIPDFIIRGVALFVNFKISATEYGGIKFKIMCLIMIALFIANVLIEYVIYLKIEKLKKNNEFVEEKLITTEMIMNNSGGKEAIREVVSFKETIYLFIIIVLIIGYDKKDGAGYVLFYGLPFAFLVYKYIESTYKNLLAYYKNKDKAMWFFKKENISIGLMIILLCIYSFLKQEDGLKEFIIYVAIMTLLLPRVFSRRKRLEEVYEKIKSG